MPIAVTEAEVKAVINTQLGTIQPFIDAALLVVNEDLAGKGMSDARLKQIGIFLSAHYVTLQERQLQSEKYGDATETYQGKTGMNYQSSHYGQSACSLDTSGALTAAGRGTASFQAL